MTVAPAPGYPSDSARNEGELKQFFEDLIGVSAELLGGSIETELTISAGFITPTGGTHNIDTESDAASDDLTNVLTTNHPDGRLILIRANNTARTVVIKHEAAGAGQIHTRSGLDISLDDNEKFTLLQRRGVDWYEVFSDNAIPNDVHTKNLIQKVGTDVASATALTLGDGNAFDITGTTAITSIASKGVGAVVILNFTGALVLTHHVSDLILPGAVNIATAAGDIAVLREYALGDWQLVSYQRDSVNIPNKNFLINGSFQIWQEATSFTLAADVQSWVADMHLAKSTGGAVAVSRQTNALSGSKQKYMMQFTGAAGVTTLSKYTRVEAVNAAPMQQKITYSMLIKNNSGGSITPVLTIKTADVEDVFSALTTRDTNTFTAIANGAEVRLEYTVDLSAETTVTRGVEFELVLEVLNGSILVGEEKVEAGSTRTEFGLAPFTTELSDSKRYFRKSYAYDTAIGTATKLDSIRDIATRRSATLHAEPTRFEEMRMVPAVTLYSTFDGTAGVVGTSTGNLAFSSIADISRTGWAYLVVTSLTTGASVNYHFVAKARLD